MQLISCFAWRYIDEKWSTGCSAITFDPVEDNFVYTKKVADLVFPNCKSLSSWESGESARFTPESVRSLTYGDVPKCIF